MPVAERGLDKLRRLILGEGFGGRIARGGAVALGVRVISVAASYVMFVVLARHMSSEDYGLFGFAFSLATFVAVVAALGQPMLVLRFIPVYDNDGNAGLVHGLLRDSSIAVLAGALACSLILLLGAMLWPKSAYTDADFIVWTGALVIVMAMGRHLAYALRAFGSIVLALAPRDVIWRAAVIAGVVVVSYRVPTMSAVVALQICFYTLLALLVLQVMLHPALRSVAIGRASFDADRPAWIRESPGLWAATVLQAVGPNLSVVLLGAVLTPAEIGPFFAAMKTATLLNLPLVAGNIVGAPLIARFYHAGKIGDVQKISNFMVMAITVPVLIAFLVIWLFGTYILDLFGDGFTEAHAAMTILAFGNLVNALCGPTAFLMNMTGHHSRYVVILLTTQLLSLAALPVAAMLFGLTGAAWAAALGMIWRNVWVSWWARVNIGVDPTLLGVATRYKGNVPPKGSAGEAS